MKIKTSNEQLMDELEILNSLISKSKKNKELAYNRLHRKLTWGWLSFINESAMSLELSHDYFAAIYYKLSDYSNLLSKQITRENIYPTNPKPN